METPGAIIVCARVHETAWVSREGPSPRAAGQESLYENILSPFFHKWYTCGLYCRTNSE